MAYPLRVHRTDQERWPQARFSEREWPPRSACIFMGQVQTHTAARNLAHIPELTGADTWPQQSSESSQPRKLSQAYLLPKGYRSNPLHPRPLQAQRGVSASQAGVGDRLLGSCQARVGMDATRLPLPRCRRWPQILPFLHPGPLWKAGWQ